MGKFFISPSRQPEVALYSTDFERALRASWQGVELRRVTNPERQYALEWKMTWEKAAIEGALNPTHHVFRLQGDLRHCAEFTIWLKNHLEMSGPLFFYDDSYTANVELHKGMQVEEIVQHFTT